MTASLISGEVQLIEWTWFFFFFVIRIPFKTGLVEFLSTDWNYISKISYRFGFKMNERSTVRWRWWNHQCLAEWEKVTTSGPGRGSTTTGCRRRAQEEVGRREASVHHCRAATRHCRRLGCTSSTRTWATATTARTTTTPRWPKKVTREVCSPWGRSPRTTIQWLLIRNRRFLRCPSHRCRRRRCRRRIFRHRRPSPLLPLPRLTTTVVHDFVSSKHVVFE